MASYKAVSIDETLLEYIEELRKHPLVKKKYAFKSTAELVRRALSEYISQLENYIKEDEAKVPIGRIFEKPLKKNEEDEIEDS